MLQCNCSLNSFVLLFFEICDNGKFMWNRKRLVMAIAPRRPARLESFETTLLL